MNLVEKCGLKTEFALFPEVPVTDEMPNAEYAKLCSVLAYGPADTGSHPLARFCQKHEIVVYDLTKIEAWLQKKLDRNTTIVDSPMRTTDRGSWESRPVYQGKMPVEALRVAAAFAAEFGDEVRFRVIHVARRPMGDPFLQVTHTKSAEVFVVAHWDEPGFAAGTAEEDLPL